MFNRWKLYQLVRKCCFATFLRGSAADWDQGIVRETRLIFRQNNYETKQSSELRITGSELALKFTSRVPARVDP